MSHIYDRTFGAKPHRPIFDIDISLYPLLHKRSNDLRPAEFFSVLSPLHSHPFYFVKRLLGYAARNFSQLPLLRTMMLFRWGCAASIRRGRGVERLI